MRLYVIDNGGSYTDHCFHFVETDEPLEVVEAVVEAYGCGAFIAGHGDFDWWDGGHRALEMFLDPGDLILKEQHVHPPKEVFSVKPCADAIPLALIKESVALHAKYAAPGGMALLDEYIARREREGK